MCEAWTIWILPLGTLLCTTLTTPLSHFTITFQFIFFLVSFCGYLPLSFHHNVSSYSSFHYLIISLSHFTITFLWFVLFLKKKTELKRSCFEVFFFKKKAQFFNRSELADRRFFQFQPVFNRFTGSKAGSVPGRFRGLSGLVGGRFPV